MSQSTAVRAPRPAARPISAPRQAPARPVTPRLRVVAAPADARSRAGLVVACLSLLVLGLICLLVLNVGLERGAYELRDQRAQTAQLIEQKQALEETINAAQGPAALAAKAQALGMVPARNATFLRRSDGAILGVPVPAVADQPPNVVKEATSRSPSARAVPRAAASPAASTAAAAANRTRATAGTQKTPGLTATR